MKLRRKYAPIDPNMMMYQNNNYRMMNYHPIHPFNQMDMVPFVQMNPYENTVGQMPYSPYLANNINNQKPFVPIEDILQNPLQPKVTHLSPYGTNYPPVYQHPYPKPPVNNKMPIGVNPILSSFKTQDGSLDINKMMETAGMMINAVSQVSSLVKGLGGVFKA